MVGLYLRRGISVLAILGSLVIATVLSVSPVAAASQSKGGKGAHFAYSGSLECPAPPANWDPTSATVDELRFYGLPLPHASSGPVYLKWVNEMRHITQRICGGEVVSKNHTDRYDTRTPSDTAGSNGDYWSGYMVESSGFNYVNGDWAVPCYSGTNNSQRALEWVGLGGVNGTNLWQAGTESDHAEGYRFWWEYLPGANIIYAGPSVSCNNSVNVEMDYNYSVSGMAYLWMYNYSNGQYWSATKSFVPGNNTAEWIVERTSCDTNKNYALAPINTVSWSEAYAASTSYNNDIVHALTYFPHYVLNMYQNNVLLSDNSSVSGGEYFSTYYHNYGVSYC